MSNWKKTTLGELINIKHGYAFKGEFFSDYPNKNILLTPGNFHIGGGFKDDKFKYYTGEVIQDYILQEGDIIVTMTDLSKTGDTLGYSAKIPKKNAIFLHNQRLGLIQLKSDEVYLDFIYWLLRTKSYQKTIVNSASGSTVRHTSPSKIQDYQFLLPTFPEQQKIADLLSCLDAKIDNLKRQNETLEKIAQLLFKRWFIDFEFPDENGNPYKSSGGEMVSSELGDIPANWRIGHLGEEFKIIMGQSPEGSSYNEQGEGIIFFQGRTDFGFRFPTTRLYTTEPKRIAEKFDVLVSVRAPVGDINIAWDRCCIGRGLSAVRSQSQSYCFYKLKSYKSKFNIFEKEGTVFGSITQENFNQMPSVIPIETLTKDFNKLVMPIDLKINNNYSQIQSLTKTRDLLLPKLMNGEIRIED